MEALGTEDRTALDGARKRPSRAAQIVAVVWIGIAILGLGVGHKWVAEFWAGADPSDQNYDLDRAGYYLSLTLFYASRAVMALAALAFLKRRQDGWVVLLIFSVFTALGAAREADRGFGAQILPAWGLVSLILLLRNGPRTWGKPGGLMACLAVRSADPPVSSAEPQAGREGPPVTPEGRENACEPMILRPAEQVNVKEASLLESVEKRVSSMVPRERLNEEIRKRRAVELRLAEILTNPKAYHEARQAMLGLLSGDGDSVGSQEVEGRP